MYNRYVPAEDGSYRKNPLPETAPPPPAPRPAKSFLKNLLPANIDTSDLIVVLLLLLIAGDDEGERSNALLTMALYFFL